jgi:dTDP-glucose pyrophosphorylase/predicted transcriptional regulator
MEVPLSEICIEPDTPILQALACMNQGSLGIVLVVNQQGKLVNTIVDGDIRRALLSGMDFHGPVANLLERMKTSEPVTAQEGVDKSMLLALMKQNHVRQVPILDQQDRVVDLVTERELLPESITPLQAVIMAGGFGKRMQPLTKDCPKPMLPVGDQPLLEVIIEQLKNAGINKVSVTTHYLGHKIREHFGDGKDLGVSLDYVTEDTPLGTAGALGLMSAPQEPLLVINGDILSQIDYRAMLDFHNENRAALTVGVRQYDMKVPFGVVNTKDALVQSLEEKPIFSFLVNAGIYLLAPATHHYIEAGKHLDMTDLIKILVAEGEKVVSFPIIEYWLDVGNPKDYERAQEFMASRD